MKNKPNNFGMTIQGGMLDALGINMYATLAKSMVEFVANSYDSEARAVNITIPFDKIHAARADVREKAKKEVEDGTREPYTVLLLPLPDEIEIVIKDDGHGMDPDDVAGKFIPVNRKRRLDKEGRETNLNSESGKRRVMGRKGLGKLAGFGVAEMVTVKTKREGDDFWTCFEMDYQKLSESSNLSNVVIPATYPAADPKERGTVITLSRLRCDALKRGKDDLENTLLQNFFGILPEDFEMRVNGAVLQAPQTEYEMSYPAERPHDGFARESIKVDEIISFDFDYVVNFRKSGNSLRSDQRGARIYCHNRLAAGPSLFRLPSGVHNYHGQDYMECIIRADQLDEFGIDLVSTDRTQLKGESELVINFLERITELMRLSLSAHYKHKEGVVEKDLDENAGQIVRLVEMMSPKTRDPARKLLKTLGAQYGVRSREFEELAPLVMGTMNAGEVLIRLIEIGTNPTDIPQIADALKDLAEIEKSDSLKIFRGRRDAIIALRNLANRGQEEWGKKSFEADLHGLMKQHPWLIRPDFVNYATSDQTLATTCSTLAQHLGVDHFSEDDPSKPDLRPDLIFLMSDPGTYEIVIVELKSPSIPLTVGHLNQLEGYISDIEIWIDRKFQHPVKVLGYLIGTRLPPERRSRDASTLESRISKAGPTTQWKVFDLHELIRNAELTHAEMIASLERDLGEDHIYAPGRSATTGRQVVKTDTVAIAGDVSPKEEEAGTGSV
ncbi:MAG: ATP-binding protein, partial [Rhizobium sp.]|nr:ATP-binding protein [Rhizobium sp.]